MTMQDPHGEVAASSHHEDTTSSIPQAAQDTLFQQGKTRRQFLGTAAKSALALTGAASLSAFASACGSGPTTTGKSQVSLIWYREGNPDEIATAKKLTDKFMAANPDIKIVIQTGADGAHLQKFNTELA